MSNVEKLQTEYLIKVGYLSISLRNWAKDRIEEGWSLSEIRAVLMNATKH